MSNCLHMWGTTGACIKPGCRSRRHPESGDGLANPLATGAQRRAQVAELLPTHTIGAIATLLRMSPKTIRRIRSEMSDDDAPR